MYQVAGYDLLACQEEGIDSVPRRKLPAYFPQRTLGRDIGTFDAPKLTSWILMRK